MSIQRITAATRYRLIEAAEVGCHECHTRPTYWCERCHRLHCLAHLRLVEWRVYQLANADDDEEDRPTAQITMEDTTHGVNVRHLVCVECVRQLAQFG